MPPDFHVMVRSGDAADEVNALVGELGGEREAGLHRCFYVTRAQQTVVMTTDADSPLARRLADMGWEAPGA